MKNAKYLIPYLIFFLVCIKVPFCEEILFYFYGLFALWAGVAIFLIYLINFIGERHSSVDIDDLSKRGWKLQTDTKNKLNGILLATIPLASGCFFVGWLDVFLAQILFLVLVALIPLVPNYDYSEQ